VAFVRRQRYVLRAAAGLRAARRRGGVVAMHVKSTGVIVMPYMAGSAGVLYARFKRYVRVVMSKYR